MGGMRRCAPAVSAVTAAVALAGCGMASSSPNEVEVQLEHTLRPAPLFVECDRSSHQPNRRYTCRVETSADRLRYVVTCLEPGRPCAIRRTADVVK